MEDSHVILMTTRTQWLSKYKTLEIPKQSISPVLSCPAHTVSNQHSETWSFLIWGEKRDPVIYVWRIQDLQNVYVVFVIASLPCPLPTLSKACCLGKICISWDCAWPFSSIRHLSCSLTSRRLVWKETFLERSASRSYLKGWNHMSGKWI